jgi:RNase P/RNase MRP subunit p29
MKSFITLLSLFTLNLVFGQDRILKIDGTVIKGKVISFQNNRLVVLQDDETEMTLPKKAIAEIKFDYQENVTITAKSVDATPSVSKPISAPASYSSAPPVQESSQKVAVEKPKEVAAPTTIQSVGTLTGFEGRVVMSSVGLKQRPVGAGRVAVAVCINAEGIVTSAKFKAVGSSTIDTDLISLAVQNARQYRFSNGKNDDCGVITYKFNLD